MRRNPKFATCPRCPGSKWTYEHQLQHVYPVQIENDIAWTFDCEECQTQYGWRQEMAWDENWMAGAGLTVHFKEFHGIDLIPY